MGAIASPVRRVSGSTVPSLHGSRAEQRLDLLALAGLVLGLLLLYLSTYAIHGYPFPVGPDAPVYLWWTRLAGAEGLSAVGGRPGVPALALIVQGTLGLGTASVIAALEIVLAVCVALASVAFVSAGAGGRTRGLLAGGFAGLFAVHLAAGYVATLAAAALFLGACALLARGTKRAAVAAAALLGAAGLAHPQFALIGAVVLALAALSSPGRGRAEPLMDAERWRVLLAVVVGLAVCGLGLLSLLMGSPQLRVDTSRDDFLESSSLGGLLPGLFRRRLLEHAASYALFVSVPLAAVGAHRADGFVARVLRAWGVVLVAGAVVALVTGVFPAERLVTFAFVLPIAAALGLAHLAERVRGPNGSPRGPVIRTLSAMSVAAIIVAFGWQAVRSWMDTPPKIFPLEVERVTEAGRYAVASPPGTRLVFTASGRRPIGSFFLTEAANAIRSAVPPDRIRDVRVILPGSFGTAATRGEEGRRLVDLYGRLSFQGMGTGRILWFDLAPFDRTHFGRLFRAPPSFGAGGMLRPEIVSQGVALIGPHPDPVGSPIDPLEPSSPEGIALATVGTLGLLGAAGYGWARVATGGRLGAIALAPAIGAGALVLTAVALSALVPIATVVGARVLTGCVDVAGYAAWGYLGNGAARS
jgi:hypothetical protein